MLDALFNPNDYLRGKRDGFNDGKSGKDKNYLRMGLSAKAVIHGQKAYDSYTAGYDAGYSLGSSLSLLGLDKQSSLSKLNEQLSSTINHEKPMTLVIDNQIELLERMRNFLSDICQQLEDTKNTLGNYLDELDGEGLDGALLEKFQDYYEVQKERLEELIRDIEDEEIPYTDRVIDHLSDLP